MVEKPQAFAAQTHTPASPLPKPRFLRRMCLALLLVLLGAVAAGIAAAYRSATAEVITADMPTLSLRAGQTQTVHFTYRPETVGTTNLLCGSAQADVALISLDGQLPQALNCTVRALAPGHATLYVALNPETRATIEVTVTD